MSKNKKKQNNKGFSLVELIIVMAIMAILVGAIAPQVFAYVEKSRETKDMEIANTVFTTLQTAIADLDYAPASFSGDITVALSSVSTFGPLLSDDIDTVAKIRDKTKSQIGRAGTIYIEYSGTTGGLKVYYGNAVGDETLDIITN